MDSQLESILLDWYALGERGCSAECIARVVSGRQRRLPAPRDVSHPIHPSDLRRCMLLLRLMPMDTIEQMRGVSRPWTVLVEHWGELKKLLLMEMDSGAGEAPRCYKRMRELLDGLTRTNGGREVRVSDVDKAIMLESARRLVALLGETPSPTGAARLVREDEVDELCDAVAQFAPGYTRRDTVERAREHAVALELELAAAARGPTTPKPRSATQTIRCSRCGRQVGYATGGTVTSEFAAAVCCDRCSKSPTVGTRRTGA